MNQLQRETPAYPGCPNAIRLFEAFTADHPGILASWKSTPIERVVASFVGAATLVAEVGVKGERTRLVKAASGEINTPDFRRYLAAKLHGSM